MKVPSFALVALLSHLLLFTYAAPPPPAAAQFISCLPGHFPNPSNPISDAVYTPQNASFSSTLQAYIKNSRFNRSTTPKPAAIVTAKHYSHVQSTVVCAKKSGLQVRIRSGGHDYEGYSYVSSVPFVVLDMFNLREVDIDIGKEVAWVQAGAITGEVYYNVAKRSNNTLAFPAGICLSLGVGGHISGGGYGTLLRKYGLSIDNIIDAQVVDSSGKILTRGTMGEDFFWAIRGGGAASFGVVLSWKLRLVRVPQTVSVFTVTKTLEQGATAAVDQWQRAAYKVDPNLFLRAQPQTIAASGGKKSTVGVSFIGFYLGGAKEMLAMVNKNFPLLGLELKDCVEMSWAESLLYWATGSPKGTPIERMLSRTSSPNNYFKSKSDYVKKPIPTNGWEAIWAKMIELGPNVLLQFNPYGGRMSEIASNATAFPHRAGNIFEMQYITYWGDESVETEKKYVSVARELYDAFTPYVSENPREAFLNYRDVDIGTNANGKLGFAYSFFEGNVDRLMKVKVEVDPDNFFSYEQSIPEKKL